jgi:hypothetical protein
MQPKSDGVAPPLTPRRLAVRKNLLVFEPWIWEKLTTRANHFPAAMFVLPEVLG